MATFTALANIFPIKFFFTIPYIVNISLLKYFQTAWLVQKLNARKYMHKIKNNAVQDRLSEN